MSNSPQTGNPTRVVVGRPKTSAEYDKFEKLAKAVVSTPKPAATGKRG